MTLHEQIHFSHNYCWREGHDQDCSEEDTGKETEEGERYSLLEPRLTKHWRNEDMVGGVGVLVGRLGGGTGGGGRERRDGRGRGGRRSTRDR